MKNRWLVILLIIVVAAFFRLYNLGSTPPGLYPDEAMNGNNALEANSTGDYKIFYPENNGREGLFINLQALSLKVFGPSADSGQAYEPWMLRIVSAVFGIFTVLGVYFLATRLFNWQIGAMSSFMLAISFWHTLFSRIGFRAIMAPFFLVWALFFFWRGLQGGKFYNFAVSGVCWGLGLYSYLSFRVIPLAFIITLFAYWQSVKKDFNHKKYLHARNQLIRGIALLGVSALIIFLPLAYYFWINPADFFGRTSQLSVFSSSNPVGNLFLNIGKTLSMFNFAGDWNWRHNFSGAPQLFFPVGILFLIGLARGLIKLAKMYKKHGHFPPAQVLLFSWLIVGLLPVIISNEGIPHALRAILVIPAVFIFAGEGLWWVYDAIGDYYRLRDPHIVNIYRKKYYESSIIATLVIVLFLAGSMFFEYDKYFNKWAKNPNVGAAFAANYAEIGRLINVMPVNIKKYVLVNAGGVLVNGIPMPAQTVMFITDTWTPEKQKAKNVYYLTVEQFSRGLYDKKSVVLPLEQN